MESIGLGGANVDIKTFKLCFDVDGELFFYEIQKKIYGKTEYNEDIFNITIFDKIVLCLIYIKRAEPGKYWFCSFFTILKIQILFIF